jgi:hypothetical protein
MTNNSWYEIAGANVKITQGDLITNCPVVRWSPNPIELKTGQEVKTLRSSIDVTRSDVVVLTQACDLENNKVRNVTLCPHLSLDRYREEWEKTMKERGQTKFDKAWVRTCEDIKNGYIWNLAMLNEGGAGDLSITHRVVDFADVYTLPRNFLESLLLSRDQPRLRLCPPYREHLSQAFARFFMRVGLPTGITKVW